MNVRVRLQTPYLGRSWHLHRRRNRGTKCGMLVHRGIQRRRFHGQPELCAEVGISDRVSRCDGHWNGVFRVSCDKRLSTARSASFRIFLDKGGHEAPVDSALLVCMVPALCTYPYALKSLANAMLKIQILTYSCCRTSHVLRMKMTFGYFDYTSGTHEIA